MRVFSYVLAGSLLLASQALAGNIDAKEREAKKACLNGDPVKGVSILTDLYVDTNDPTFIYNQGRCYEQNNRYEDAISRFREYVRKVGPKHKGDRASAEKHIADCQRLMAEKKSEDAKNAAAPVPAATAAPPSTTVQVPPSPPLLQTPPPTMQNPTPPPPAAAPVPPMPPSPEPQVERAPALSSSAVAPSPAAAPGAGLRTAGLVVAAVGGAAVVAGVVLNLEHNNKVSDLTPDYTRDKDSSSKTYKTLSMLGYGVGAACVVGGAVMYYLGWRAGSETQVALVPSVIDGGAGALLAGAF